MNCPFCKADPVPAKEIICRKCREEIFYYKGFRCRYCGNRLLYDSGSCPECFGKKKSYNAFYNLGYYDRMLGDIIIRMKFRENISLGKALGALAAEHLEKLGVEYDVILPVPLSPGRFHERGFDQTLEIAKAMKKRTGRKVMDFVIGKTDIPPLVGKNRAERADIMRKAFFAKRGLEKVEGLNVLALDDVCTTGATMNAFTKLIRRYGPLRITAYVIARK